MGAPKQKWTAEEEAALKAGISKYGVGKWSTILKDPEFSGVLRSRSNVDLKDKWRNLNCMANGLGSRYRARVSVKNVPATPKDGEDATTHSEVTKMDIDASSSAASNETSHDVVPRKKISRLDDVILEAIRKLKEPRGSNRAAISQYIEDHYSAPADLEKTLAANLKSLTENRQLIKVKSQYRIAPKSTSIDAVSLPANESKKGASGTNTNSLVLLTKARVDAELAKMMSMSAEEAAAVAAQAVADAEAAIAEAEAAAREAEAAEAEAEAARCFADAAEKAQDFPAIRVW